MFLALVEGGALFVLTAGAVWAWPGVDPPTFADAATRVVGSAACCVTPFYYFDLYHLGVVRNPAEFHRRLLRSIALSALLLLILYALMPEARPVGSLAGSVALVVLIFTGLTLPIRWLHYVAVERRVTAERVIVVGKTPLSHELVEAIEEERHWRLNLVGLVDDDAEGTDDEAATGPLLRYPFQTPVHDFDRLVEETQPDRVIVAIGESSAARSLMGRLLALRGRGIIVENGLEAYERLTGKVPLHYLHHEAVVFSRDFRPSHGYAETRRALSLLVMPLVLVVLLPVFALISLLVWLDSGRPIFFIQQRIGLHGRRFRLLKFRTMYPPKGATASEWASENAHRITRVGNWLRRYRLDELPQFLNVLRGEMSLIGPRPHPVTNHDLFFERIPWYPIRFLVRPGITGWAQVRSGYADGIEQEREKMGYDLYYIKKFSPWLDLRILADTIKIVLVGDERSVRPYRSAARPLTPLPETAAPRPRRARVHRERESPGAVADSPPA